MEIFEILDLLTIAPEECQLEKLRVLTYLRCEYIINIYWPLYYNLALEEAHATCTIFFNLPELRHIHRIYQVPIAISFYVHFDSDFRITHNNFRFRKARLQIQQFLQVRWFVPRHVLPHESQRLGGFSTLQLKHRAHDASA